MRAFVTSIGERTTGICVEQLERLGFKVTLLGTVEPWSAKYRRFLESVGEEPALRVDADIIPNRALPAAVEDAMKEIKKGEKMGAQFKCYGLYCNGLIDSVTLYTPAAVQAIFRGYEGVTELRPETSAWRLPELDGKLVNSQAVVGMHGFFQDSAHLLRGFRHKLERRQIERTDFDLATKLISL